jgi:MATE family multidrug resistance protein
VTGSALSTCLARVYMAAALLFFIWYFERDLGRFVRPPDAARLLKLLKLGLPAATQIMLEIGAFGAAAMLAGRLMPEALAAHQIALNCASVTYMVPLGIASASAVSVGQAIGKKDAVLARSNGYTGMGLACAFMACSALAFLVIPRQILSVYSTDAFVITLGVKLLAIAALFQLFDGIQTVATGALRGLGDTNLPMVVNFAGYWLFGLPVGYILCFRMGFGIAGLWWGLTFALIGISIVLLLAWQRKTSKSDSFDNPKVPLGTGA